MGGCPGSPCRLFSTHLDRREAEQPVCLSRQPRIGFIRDSAFWFYYPDNLEALERLGATLVECSALNDSKLPPVDALYIGGGFPETHAASLSANVGFRRSLHEAVEKELPVYAECGGLMYLGKELLVEEKVFPMTGVFPFRFVLDKRPHGHGYTILDVDAPNPYFPIGEDASRSRVSLLPYPGYGKRDPLPWFLK